MTGAVVHDQLELHGWEVEMASGEGEGTAPLACKTDA